MVTNVCHLSYNMLLIITSFFFLQFFDIEILARISKTLAKLVEFTLEK